ncbi:PREDICTED: 28S ribosomal protein S31, mitochondrial isoform X2 [Trachymyrmex cornetzi]|uniref:28S ribosomal protein S31, mitochondrial isoform X2 n=1 Tax=Trachymyrmex cornetzi TaxID=471704 RepID=UPI00084EDA35|nr:PREDICTED: 28S ribosomal protein S31, mitochondrial isoform X2 [Trachymyrmex cornetzi]
MFPLHILSKCNIRSSSGILFQWINISTRLCSSSSSSSDSSDSDSDSEKTKPKATHVKSASSASATSDNKYDLENFLNNMIQTRKTQKTIDVAMQPKKKKDKSNKKHESFEKKIVSAAEGVANVLGGDKTKTTSDLLEKVLASRVTALKEEQGSTYKNVKQLANYDVKKSSQDEHLEKKSIIQTLLDEYNNQPIKKVIENSVSRKLLQSVKASKEKLQDTDKTTPHTRFKDIDLWNGKPSDIFESMNAASPNIPELKTWAALEQRELKTLTTYPPANVFQELILWTEQGKLWKFPIDNEQGMEEEHNVHFSEHVFMERHLKGWCPKSGPIRHFMELVCTGLSKNPYLTVQEKIGHIMWYKEYFESKQDLLQEVGAIQQPFSDKIKEITK